MPYALIDDAGQIRGLWQNNPGNRTYGIEERAARPLVEIADDDPRVLALLESTEPRATQ